MKGCRSIPSGGPSITLSRHPKVFVSNLLNSQQYESHPLTNMPVQSAVAKARHALSDLLRCFDDYRTRTDLGAFAVLPAQTQTAGILWLLQLWPVVRVMHMVATKAIDDAVYDTYIHNTYIDTTPEPLSYRYVLREAGPCIP